MREYTPTTESVREDYVRERVWVSANVSLSPDEARREFDRWLWSVKAEMWDAGMDSYVKYLANMLAGEDVLEPENPYREGQ